MPRALDAGVLALLAVALAGQGWLYWRSYAVVDEITYSRGSARYEVASDAGTVKFWRVAR